MNGLAENRQYFQGVKIGKYFNNDVANLDNNQYFSGIIVDGDVDNTARGRIGKYFARY